MEDKAKVFRILNPYDPHPESWIENLVVELKMRNKEKL